MKMMDFTSESAKITLHSPTCIPMAGSYLFNPRMMIQMNCRGYAVSQFMQPEPSRYSCGPSLEQKTFIQPEPQYYSHHPGRFFYVRDNVKSTLISLPYAPVKTRPEKFEFCADRESIQWQVEQDGIKYVLRLSLAEDEIAELWELGITNVGNHPRSLAVYPCFSIGYQSWMNQSASFDSTLDAIVASKVTPYQQAKEYEQIKHFHELTYLLSDTEPDSWETRLGQFEGQGGLHYPDGIRADRLARGDACYDTPVAVMQFNVALAAGQSIKKRYVFGAAKSHADIAAVRQRLLLDPKGFETAAEAYRHYLLRGPNTLELSSPDPAFDHFVNYWLPQQVRYHGELHRLSTDPQTRNYLQDNMGMCFVKPARFKHALLRSLSQQSVSGAMPDGILLHPGAELKYINQVPHSDHCVWLPICFSAYLDETNDLAILKQEVGFSEDQEKTATVFAHIELAMNWLVKQKAENGLMLIAQGDWCDPMNMVGIKGQGTSGWLTFAAAWAFKLWAHVCRRCQRPELAGHWQNAAAELVEAATAQLWDGDWFARGITDNGNHFGIKANEQGRIYLNAQSFALLCNAVGPDRAECLIKAVEEQLQTPFGYQMLAPAYDRMHPDIGRLTQKFPGTAENGSIYNHAAAFYAYALYQQKRGDQAFNVLSAMLVRDNDAHLRQQLPNFIPNYYRGAVTRFPDYAGRSSQLFNTGTVAWFYRCVTEELVGIKGQDEGVIIDPKIPSDWPGLKATRRFRDASIELEVRRIPQIEKMQVWLNGALLDGNVIDKIEAGQNYHVRVCIT